MSINKQLKGTAIGTIVLGSIHICATPLIIMQSIQLPLQQLLPNSYFFIFAGISLVFIGWAQIFSIKHIEEFKGLLKLYISGNWILVFAGIGAVITMWNNPFAYLSLLLALYQKFLLIRYHAKSH
jgi:hypothetical protein